MPRAHEDTSQVDWRVRSQELREEFFALMDQLADKEITTTTARLETTRINREIAELIKLTARKRD